MCEIGSNILKKFIKIGRELENIIFYMLTKIMYISN